MVISIPDGAPGLSDEALAVAAKQGDRAAAGEYFARHHAYLLGAARSIAGTRLDPEDLLSAAFVQLLDQWDRGAGPEENATAYVIRSMRNAAIDESRSPRSRVDTFGDVDESHPIHAIPDDPRFHRAELHEEFVVVRRALDRLPADQRLVLRETVVHGRKPADVAADGERSPGAVSSLAARARRGLRRAVLIEFLSAGGPECRTNAESLPDAVASTPDAHRETERGLAHVRTCPRCRSNWARFAALASALGILPALVLSDWTLGAAPASASPSESGPGGGAAGGLRPGRPRPGGSRSAAGSASGAKAFLAGALRAPLVIVGASILLVGVGAGVTASVLGANDPSRVEVGAPGILTDASGIPEAVFDATVERSGPTTVLSLDFDIPGEAWRIDRASMVLPEGVSLSSAPSGWVCASESDDPVCEVGPLSPGGGALTFVTAGGEAPSGAFSIDLVVVTEGGLRVDARASGTFGDSPRRPADGFPGLSRS